MKTGAPRLVCVKTHKEFPFELNVFNNPEANDSTYSNLILEWGHKVEGYQSLVPFKKLHISYGAKDTPLVENRDIAALLGLKNLWVKDESYNPYGTHKDRRSEYIVNVAIEQWVDKIVCLTAGNAGYSLSRYCSRAGIDYTSLIFPWVSEERKKSLAEWGQVITIDGSRYNGILRPRDFRQIVEEYDRYERGKRWKNIWAVTNSFEPISINAYKELFYEIYAQNPDYVVVPCGSGDIIIGIWLAIQELKAQTKIIAVAPKWEHPLAGALRYWKEEFEIEDYREFSIAEKLTTPFTAVLPILYKIFADKKHLYCEADNETILKTAKRLWMFWLRTEYSAAVPFAAFLTGKPVEISPNSRVVIISTGKGLEN